MNRNLDVVIAEKLFELKVVGWWYCYLTDEDGWNVCDQEPEKWWSGSNDKHPVYVVNEDEKPDPDLEPKDIVFGHYRHNLKRVPTYTDSWDAIGRVIMAMQEKGYELKFSTPGTTNKMYEARIEWNKNKKIISVYRESPTMAIAEAVVKALESK